MKKLLYANLRELVEHAASFFPNTRFFPCRDERMPSVSGAELLRLCQKAVGGLSFLPPHSHIGILGPSSAAWLAAYFAVVSAGYTIVPLHDGMKPEELGESVRMADCALLLYDTPCAAVAESLRASSEGLRVLELHDFLESLAPAEEHPFPELPDDDTAALYFTSGTTARSRCVKLTHRNIGSQISAVLELLPLAQTDVGLSLLPLSHTYEMMTYIAGALHCGGTLYLNESVRTVKKNLREKRPTILVAVPLILQTLHKEILNTAKKEGKLDRLLRAIRLNRRLQMFGLDLSARLFGELREILGGRLHTIICGGAALDTELILFFRALGIEVLQGYGITECSPVVATNSPVRNRVGSVGRCLPCCEIKLEAREICVRGESVSPGYYKDPEADAAAYRDGWFHTGDLGRLDGDGYLYITGRLKNLIILSNGENVSPEELEERLYRVDGILDAVVCERSGKITAELFVDRTLIPDQAAAWNVVRSVNRGLASYKQIGDLVLRDSEFEKTVTKKIKRYMLGGS